MQKLIIFDQFDGTKRSGEVQLSSEAVAKIQALASQGLPEAFHIGFAFAVVDSKIIVSCAGLINQQEEPIQINKWMGDYLEFKQKESENE